MIEMKYDTRNFIKEFIIMKFHGFRQKKNAKLWPLNLRAIKVERHSKASRKYLAKFLKQWIFKSENF